MSWLKRLRGNESGRNKQPPQERERTTSDTLRKPEGGGQSTVLREPSQEAVSHGAVLSSKTEKSAGHSPSSAFGRPAAGERVADTYEIRRQLGEGAMGVVYLAQQLQWGQEVVLKIPRAEIVADPEHRGRVIREAEAWTDLGLHPHVAYCYYVHPVDDVLLLVVEYVDGGNLREWITDGRCADLRTSLDLAIQLCHGIEHAHGKGLIHRDIKPENILLTKDGRLKVTDFGIARTAASLVQEISAIGVVTVPDALTVGGIGTYEYMAPEQFVSAHEVDMRADVFACGVCLYEMLCGRRPYGVASGSRQTPPDPRQLRQDLKVPPRLSELLQRCVDWDPERRSAGMADVRKALSAIYEEHFHEPSVWAELPPVSLRAEGLNNRALSYLALGKVDQADQTWNAALEIDPHHPEVVFNSGLSRWRRGKTQDVTLLNALAAIRESGNAQPRVDYLSALVHLERDDPESAVRLLGGLEERDPDSRVKRVLALAQARYAKRQIEGLNGHHAGVLAVDLSVDGRIGISGSRDKTLNLWDVPTGQCIQSLALPATSVEIIVAVDADRRLVLIESHGALHLADVMTGQYTRTFTGHAGPSYSAVFSRGGRYLVSAHSGGFVNVWEVATGLCLRSLEHSGVSTVDVSADGRLALSSGADHTVKLWEVATGRCLQLFRYRDPYMAYSVQLGSDCSVALSGGDDGHLQLWEVATGRHLRAFARHDGWVSSVRLSSDNRLAVSAATDQRLKVWEISTGRCLRTFEAHHDVTSIGLSADGRWAISGGEDGAVRLWRVPADDRISTAYFPCAVAAGEAGLAVQRTFRQELKRARESLESGDAVSSARHLRKAREQIGWQRDPEAVRLWSSLYLCLPRKTLVDGWRVKELSGHVPLKLSADGHIAVSVSQSAPSGFADLRNNTLQVWNLRTGLCDRTIPVRGAITAISLSAEGRYCLGSGGFGPLRLWDTTTGDCLRQFDEGYTIAFLALSRDARFAVSGGWYEKDTEAYLPGLWAGPGAIRLWDLRTGRSVRTLRTRSHPTCIDLSLDGRYVLSGEGATLGLWDLGVGQFVRAFVGHAGAIRSVCFSADGRFALSGGDDKTLKWWELATGRCLQTLVGHSGSVLSAKPTTDGRFAVSGSRDLTVKVWEIVTGRCIRTLEGHSGFIESVEVSPDGCFVLSGSSIYSERDTAKIIVEDFGTIKQWFLDWELVEREPAQWHDEARPHLVKFLTERHPYGDGFPGDRHPSDEDIKRALIRVGRPVWTEEDFQNLLFSLGCAGYGWLRPEGVWRELERMAATWPDDKLT